MTKLELPTLPDSAHMAPLPYPLQRRNVFGALRPYGILIRILLAEYRRIWFMNVFMGFLIPFGFLFFLKSSTGSISHARAIFLLGGNMATSIAFGPMSFLITKLGWAKQSQEFDYWIALPLPKMALVFAIVTVSLLFALPGLVSIYILGSLLFALPFTNFLLLIPSEVLPLPLRFLSRFVPTTYVAEVFRAVISGTLPANFFFDIVALVFFSIFFLSVAYTRVDWRSSR